MKLNAKQMQKLSAIKNSFYEDLKIEFLFHSNHLEGSTFTKENLEKLLLDKQVEGVHFLDDVYETTNSLKVFDMVVEDSDKELSKFMLFDWHRTLKKNSIDDEISNTGCWKKYENRLRGVDIKLALPDEVDSLMFDLIMDWNENNNPTIEDIAKFHYKFEMIHPFQDGNGRIGRFLIFKQCLESKLDLIAIDNMYSKEYKEALYKAEKTDDISELVCVFKKCQDRLDKKLGSYHVLIETVKSEIQ
ncbi:MAG: Fic family protein [Erysipelotrichaceae bacterium]|nr:Fic family protein [Solobacterium sp.]MDY4792217.1 Fic family protein [Erysipelotrichaceae bacterium]